MGLQYVWIFFILRLLRLVCSKTLLFKIILLSAQQLYFTYMRAKILVLYYFVASQKLSQFAPFSGILFLHIALQWKLTRFFMEMHLSISMSPFSSFLTQGLIESQGGRERSHKCTQDTPSIYGIKLGFIISTLGRSQGLLYKHCRH